MLSYNYLNIKSNKLLIMSWTVFTNHFIIISYLKVINLFTLNNIVLCNDMNNKCVTQISTDVVVIVQFFILKLDYLIS